MIYYIATCNTFVFWLFFLCRGNNYRSIAQFLFKQTVSDWLNQELKWETFIYIFSFLVNSFYYSDFVFAVCSFSMCLVQSNTNNSSCLSWAKSCEPELASLNFLHIIYYDVQNFKFLSYEVIVQYILKHSNLTPLEIFNVILNSLGRNLLAQPIYVIKIMNTLFICFTILKWICPS